MNTLDFIIIGVLFLSMIQSYRVGFLDEALSIVIFILSGYFAYILFPHFIPLLDFVSENPVVLKVCSIFVLFFTFFIVGKIIKSFILDIVDDSELSGFDKFLGMVLGLVKGAVVISALVLIFSYIQWGSIQELINSSLISNKILITFAKYKEYIII